MLSIGGLRSSGSAHINVIKYWSYAVQLIRSYCQVNILKLYAHATARSCGLNRLDSSGHTLGYATLRPVVYTCIMKTKQSSYRLTCIYNQEKSRVCL